MSANTKYDFVWIDDQHWKLKPVMESLTELGFSYFSVENFRDALTQVEEIKKTRLIILDMIIPTGGADVEDKDDTYLGIELLQRLRSEGVDQPVIIFTIVREKSAIELARNETGVLNVFMKAERNSDELIKLAKQVLEQKTE